MARDGTCVTCKARQIPEFDFSGSDDWDTQTDASEGFEVRETIGTMRNQNRGVDKKMKEYIAPIGLAVGIIVIVGFGIVSLSSTNNREVKEVSLINQEEYFYHIKELFEKDGCKVYRFVDDAKFHYYTDCSETITDISEQCGKVTCEYMENIPTDLFEDGGEPI